MKRFVIVWYVLQSANALLFGQEILELNPSSHSGYLDQAMPEELYRFEADPAMESLKDDVLQKTGKKENFELASSNVESVASVLDNQKRWVLYSRRYFNKEKDPVARAAMLAHEIGHCVHGHKYAPGQSDDEEIEADEFMGYALCLIGVPISDAGEVAARWPRTWGPDIAARRAAILRGFYKAEASLRNAEHAAWFEENANEVVQNIPRFPLPAPAWSAMGDLTNYVNNSTTLGEVDQKIRKALDTTGVFSRRYYHLPGGFAMVTRLERLDKEGNTLNDANRWKISPVWNSMFSVDDYLASLNGSEPGRYRIFAFMATDASLTADNKYKIDRDEATIWLNEGATMLPKSITDRAYDKNMKVSVLVYEFLVTESSLKPVFMPSTEPDGLKHLAEAHILDFLKK